MAAKENVLMKKATPDDTDRVTRALKKADFGKKLNSLPDGIETQLTREFDENGTNLSGGESQKIAISRIFASDAQSTIFILDEPSSALDPVSEYKLKKVGLCGWYLFPYVMMTAFAKALGSMEHLVPADELIRPIFMKKSAEEVACLKASARASEAGFKAILENIKPGMTESELCGIATAAMTAAGAECTGYPIWCCSGSNSDQAISRPTMRKVQCGEIVHFSIGAKIEGYSSSIGRPVVLGNCPDELRKFLQVGLDAANMTFDVMRAGVKSGDAAMKVHDFIRSKGYGDAILYGPAHGCGQMECEYPFLETSSEYMLEADMTFMQDMFLHRPGVGFRWEDGLLVRAEGPAEMLSSYGRQINII